MSSSSEEFADLQIPTDVRRFMDALNPAWSKRPAELGTSPSEDRLRRLASCIPEWCAEEKIADTAVLIELTAEAMQQFLFETVNCLGAVDPLLERHLSISVDHHDLIHQVRDCDRKHGQVWTMWGDITGFITASRLRQQPGRGMSPMEPAIELHSWRDGLGLQFVVTDIGDMRALGRLASQKHKAWAEFEEATGLKCLFDIPLPSDREPGSMRASEAIDEFIRDVVKDEPDDSMECFERIILEFPIAGSTQPLRRQLWAATVLLKAHLTVLGCSRARDAKRIADVYLAPITLAYQRATG